jgi:hypothetical protein
MYALVKSYGQMPFSLLSSSPPLLGAMLLPQILSDMLHKIKARLLARLWRSSGKNCAVQALCGKYDK